MATGGANIAFPAVAAEGTSQVAEAASEAIKAMPAERPWPAAATPTLPWLTVTEALRTQPWLTAMEALRTRPYLTVAAVDMQPVAVNMQPAVVADTQVAVVNMQAAVAADTAAAAVGTKQPAQQITSGEAPSFAAFFTLTIR